MILVTGGAGFIGANFVLDWLAQSDEALINLDSLTCTGNLDTLRTLAGDPRQRFMVLATSFKPILSTPSIYWRPT